MKQLIKLNVSEDQANKGDCVARAITKASSIPYYIVHEDLKEWCKRDPRWRGHPDTGIMDTPDFMRWMVAYGFQRFTPEYAMSLEDIPNIGRYVAFMRGPGGQHAVAVVDGQVFDSGKQVMKTPRVVEFHLWVGTALSK